MKDPSIFVLASTGNKNDNYYLLNLQSHERVLKGMLEGRWLLLCISGSACMLVRTLDFIDDMHCVVQILNCFVHSGLCVACVVSAGNFMPT